MSGGSRYGVNCPTLVRNDGRLPVAKKRMQVVDGCTPFLFRKFSNMVRVKLIFIGDILYYELDRRKITGWKSSLFKINPKIDLHPLTTNADTPDWGYSDKTLQKTLKEAKPLPMSTSLSLYLMSALRTTTLAAFSHKTAYC